MPETTTPYVPPGDPLRSRPALAVFAGWWVLLAVLFAVQIRMSMSFRGAEKPWLEALVVGAIDSFSWATVAVILLWLTARVRPGGHGWLRVIGIHAAVAAVVMPGRLWAMSALIELILDSTSTTYTTAQRIIIALPTNLLAYVLLIGLGYTFHFIRRYRQRELEAAQLEARLAGAELEVMKMQLQPAFLSRGLESIAALMHRDVRAADRGLALFGDMLRLTLQRAPRQTVSLHEELELLELFLALQKEELGTCLCIEWVGEPEVLDAEVPSLLLQPLVERVIRSDRSRTGDPLRLRISTRRQDDSLEVGILTRGSRPTRGARDDAGEGSTTVRSRLHQLYGPDRSSFLIERGDGGTLITIRVPFREVDGNGTGTLITSAAVRNGGAA